MVSADLPTVVDAEQRRAAIFTDNHAFVWASAGTGKTTILTLRALYLLLRAPLLKLPLDCSALYDPPPTAGRRDEQARHARIRAATAAARSVVLITFTRKAAAEMQTRLFQLLDAVARGRASDPDAPPMLGDVVARILEELTARYGGSAADRLRLGALALVEVAAELPITTVHGYTARLLSRHPIEAGLPASASFADEDDPQAADLAPQLVDRWMQRVVLQDAALAADLEEVLTYLDFPDLRQWLADVHHHPWIIDELQRWRKSLDEIDFEAQVEGLLAAIEELAWRFRPKPEWFRINAVRDQLNRFRERIVKGEDEAWLEEGAEVVANWEDLFDQTSAKRSIEQMSQQQQLLLQRSTMLALHATACLRYRLDDAFAGFGRLLAAFGEWSRNAAVRELSLVTFDHMIVLAEKVLRRQAVVRRERDGLQAILVDEFQDTDPHQLKLLRHLLLDSPSQQPVLGFFVGDNKQSIYRFRHADLTHLHHFVEEYRGYFDNIDDLELTTTFRATEPLTRFINAFFAPCFVEVAGVQEGYRPLRARPPDPATPFADDPPSQTAVVPEVIRLTHGRDRLRLEQRVRLLGQQTVAAIVEHVAAGGRYRDVMVLVRTNRDVDDLLLLLEQEGIPAVSTGTATYLRQPEVLDLVSLFIVLLEPSDTVALASVLRGPLVSLGDDVLHDISKDHGLPADLLDPTADESVLNALPQRARARLTRLRELAAQRDELPIALWVEKVRRFVPDALYLRKDDLEGRAVVRLDQLADSVRNVMETGRVPPLVWLLHQRHRAMRAGDWDADLGEDVTVIDESVDAVRVLTVHKAKGLEARFTIIPSWATMLHDVDEVSRRAPRIVQSTAIAGGVVTHHRGVDARWGPMRIRSRGYGPARQREVAHERAEALRLAYVAATRAKQRLLMLIAAAREPVAGGLLAQSTDPPLSSDPETPSTIADKTAVLRGARADVTAAGPLLRPRPPRILSDDYIAHWAARRAAFAEANQQALLWSPTRAHRDDDLAPAGGTAADAPPEEDEAPHEIDDVPRLRGILVHEYLELHLTDERVETEWLHHIAAAMPLGDHRDVVIEGATSILTRFFDGQLKDEQDVPYIDRVRAGTILGREVPFYLQREGQLWTGVMDLVLQEPDGTIVSIDYKATARTEVKASYATQRTLYTEALARAFPNRDVGFEFFWLGAPEMGR